MELTGDFAQLDISELVEQELWRIVDTLTIYITRGCCTTYEEWYMYRIISWADHFDCSQNIYDNCFDYIYDNIDSDIDINLLKWILIHVPEGDLDVSWVFNKLCQNGDMERAQLFYSMKTIDIHYDNDEIILMCSSIEDKLQNNIIMVWLLSLDKFSTSVLCEVKKYLELCNNYTMVKYIDTRNNTSDTNLPFINDINQIIIGYLGCDDQLYIKSLITNPADIGRYIVKNNYTDLLDYYVSTNYKKYSYFIVRHIMNACNTTLMQHWINKKYPYEYGSLLTEFSAPDYERQHPCCDIILQSSVAPDSDDEIEEDRTSELFMTQFD